LQRINNKEIIDIFPQSDDNFGFLVELYLEIKYSYNSFDIGYFIL